MGKDIVFIGSALESIFMIKTVEIKINAQKWNLSEVKNKRGEKISGP